MHLTMAARRNEYPGSPSSWLLMTHDCSIMRAFDCSPGDLSLGAGIHLARK